MGTLYRPKSAHMTDLKGKGILYEDDDVLIKLTDQDDSHGIKEYRMSLFERSLPRRNKMLRSCCSQCQLDGGLQDRITDNELGNGKFLFNFTSEDGINHFLRQGPFHYNYCMFVLVRWEPIIHDDYPWVIPFCIRLIGVPLHIWTVKNQTHITKERPKIKRTSHKAS
ncbi:hypothetical protein N665_0125s0029 [Sinapis alba]|nr:hypothetical protein N665_0125s0029 [Sinapis alba]